MSNACIVSVIFVFMVVPAFLSPVIGYLSDNYGRKAISAAGMITMAVISPVLAVKYSSVYQIIPPLMIFGLSSPMTLTPILPEMGEVVHDIVSFNLFMFCVLFFTVLLIEVNVSTTGWCRICAR